MVRYVGQSAIGLARPRQHNLPSQKRHNATKVAWIAEMAAAGIEYEIVILEEIAKPGTVANSCWWWTGLNPTALNDAERWWIAYGKMLGWPLTNGNAGGVGGPGGRRSSETRRRMSDAHKGQRHSEETRRKIAESAREKTVAFNAQQADLRVRAGWSATRRLRQRAVLWVCLEAARIRREQTKINRAIAARKRGAARRMQTHCKWGHELVPENLYTSRKYRACRLCVARRNRERSGRTHAEAMDARWNALNKEERATKCQHLVAIAKARAVAARERTLASVVGVRFGDWIAVDVSEPRNGAMASCVCSCGSKRSVSVSKLKSGRSKSCGCRVNRPDRYTDVTLTM